MSDLYSKDILRLASQIPLGELAGAVDVEVQKTSRICGSRVTLKGQLSADKLSFNEVAVVVKACALGQASVGFFAPHIKGITLAESQSLRALLADILLGTKDAPDESDPHDGQWAGLKVFEPAREHRGRHSSILLILDTVIEGLSPNK